MKDTLPSLTLPTLTTFVEAKVNDFGSANSKFLSLAERKFLRANRFIVIVGEMTYQY